ncbi:MAG: tol-pal system YbgF family protein [Polyangiaceae bacterium]
MKFGWLFAILLASSAPMQCASEPDFDERREETPGEALFGLAEQFKAQGNEKARRETLEYLIAKYPNSRFAEMARSDLAKTPSGK